MVSLGMSEFTFGYAFLHEQTTQHWGNIYAVPVLPNLAQEAEEGWDARLPITGMDYYYQFKLSDYLVRKNAKYIKDGTYNSPYFRIALHKNENNRQHRRLRVHAILNPNTYYVAPEITNNDDFNNIFLARQVSSRSRLIPLNECEDINDEDQHYITFQENDQAWIQHSEKKIHDKSVLGKNLQEFYKDSLRHRKKLNKEFAEKLYVKIVNSTREIMSKESIEIDRFGRYSVMELLDEGIINETRAIIFDRISKILSFFY